MAASCVAARNVLNFLNKIQSVVYLTTNQIFCRSIFTTPAYHLKEIHRHETEKEIVIEGVKVKSERTGKVINVGSRGGCPLCKVGIRDIKHTDILILSQFLNSDGTLIPQHISGLCNKQQFRLVRAVALAQRAGLVPKKPGTPIFGGWEKYNTYFKRF